MVARVATARRLAAIVYHVLRGRRAYQPRPPKRSLPEGPRVFLTGSMSRVPR
jgi:hypothetical protein